MGSLASLQLAALRFHRSPAPYLRERPCEVNLEHLDQRMNSHGVISSSPLVFAFHLSTWETDVKYFRGLICALAGLFEAAVMLLAIFFGFACGRHQYLPRLPRLGRSYNSLLFELVDQPRRSRVPDVKTSLQ